MQLLRRALLGFLLLWPAATPAGAQVQYEPEIQVSGATDRPLQDALQNASQLVALQDKPPATVAALRRRADNDLSRLRAVMQAEGYWQAKVEYRLDTRTAPAKVAVTVTPGPLFHLAKVAFLLPSGAPEPLLERRGPAALGLVIGGPARSAPVEAANDGIIEALADNGHPFAKLLDRKVVVDVATDSMSVTYTVDPGAAAVFGDTSITGLRRVDQDFVQRRIGWKAGEPYDQRQVDSTRQDLLQSQLFGEVRITPAAAPDAAGRVAMSIALIEAPPRSVGAGVGYNTNIGLGARLFWEHRNLFGEGEDLRLTAGAAQRQLGLDAAFRRPDFLLRKQDLLSEGELLYETTDAYRSRRESVFGGVEELMWPPYTIGTGVSLERAFLTETSRDENYLLVGLPSYVRRDTTDSLLDPTLGSRTTFSLTPYHGLLGRELNFFVSRLEERLYRRIADSDRMVIAGLGSIGSVVGAGLEDVPADKRLYEGGAGSVRGYGYQRAGPLDSAGVPIGGRSSLEFSLEFRYRFTKTLGLTPFFDAGDVYPSSLPNRLQFFYGAGLGLRYYTPIGPIRLDLAFPIEKRPSDSVVQVYISLGQAF